MELFYLLGTFLLIVFLFIVVKRPMYEVMAICFVVLLAATGSYERVPHYLYQAATNYLLYTIIAFIAFSVVLNKTGIISDFIDIIMSLVGRFPGGAGYVALLASSFMGALSGTGPGNAAAIGVIAIPAMKRSGYSAELAAVVEASASALGPVIPPSGTVAVIFSMLVALYPGCCTFSQFWLIMWGVSFWLIIQRLINLFVAIKRAKIGPVPESERLPLRVSLKKGWKAVLLPVVILIPFLLDALCSHTIINARLGKDGAELFSSALLAMVPSFAILYVLLISDKRPGVRDFVKMFDAEIPTLAPVAALVFAAFCISEAFNDIGIESALMNFLSGFNIPWWFVVIVIPLIITVLGMFLETLTVMLIIGSPAIALGASVGINPILMAAVTCAIISAMSPMTPPVALTFFVSVGIAEADFAKSTKAIISWCVCQYICIVLLIAGILPVFGMVDFIP